MIEIVNIFRIYIWIFISWWWRSAIQ